MYLFDGSSQVSKVWSGLGSRIKKLSSATDGIFLHVNWHVRWSQLHVKADCNGSQLHFFHRRPFFGSMSFARKRTVELLLLFQSLRIFHENVIKLEELVQRETKEKESWTLTAYEIYLVGLCVEFHESFKSLSHEPMELGCAFMWLEHGWFGWGDAEVVLDCIPTRVKHEKWELWE